MFLKGQTTTRDHAQIWPAIALAQNGRQSAFLVAVQHGKLYLVAALGVTQVTDQVLGMVYGLGIDGEQNVTSYHPGTGRWAIGYDGRNQNALLTINLAWDNHLLVTKTIQLGGCKDNAACDHHPHQKYQQ